jgi:hypothetical protein
LAVAADDPQAAVDAAAALADDVVDTGDRDGTIRATVSLLLTGIVFQVRGDVIEVFEEPEFHASIGDAWDKVDVGDYDQALHMAEGLVDLATDPDEQWHAANLIHHGHTILGVVYIHKGMVTEAEEELLESARTSGSAELGTHGPNLYLAHLLLQRQRTEIVLEFFDLCSAFWAGRPEQVSGWREQIEEGKVPDFGANLWWGRGPNDEI